MAKTSLDIDQVCEMIIEGATYRELAHKLNVKLSTLHDYLSKDEHSARVREALRISADSYADKGERVLIEAKSTMVEVQRAKELAQYYKWKASKRAPKTYADKIDVTSAGNELKPVVINLGSGISPEVQQ